MSIETGMPEVPLFAMYSGCVLDQISWQMQRPGLLTATARLVAQGEKVATTTGAFGDQREPVPTAFRAALQPVVQRSDSVGDTGETRGIARLCLPPIVGERFHAALPLDQAADNRAPLPSDRAGTTSRPRTSV